MPTQWATGSYTAASDSAFFTDMSAFVCLCGLGWVMSRMLSLFLSEEGADSERVDTISRYLRAELLELDIADVTAQRSGEALPGSRSGAVAVIGGLLVNLGGAAQGLALVVTAVREWLKRGETRQRTVRLELDGDVLELSQPSPADQERLIELFISRHQAGTGRA
jgi:hypothetical protein